MLVPIILFHCAYRIKSLSRLVNPPDRRVEHIPDVPYMCSLANRHVIGKYRRDESDRNKNKQEN